MAKSNKQLYLRIEQAGRVYHHHLNDGTRFTIGKHPENDITVYGDQYPKKHTLFSRKNGHYELKLQQYMHGEVVAGESKLAFKDMIAHHLLTLKGDSFLYPVTQGKAGFIKVGDAKISFKVVSNGLQDPATAELQKFQGFSWIHATMWELTRDLPFKAIVLGVLLFHLVLLGYMNRFSTNLAERPTVRKIPERFAKFIVQNAPATESAKKTATAAAQKEGSKKDVEDPRTKKKKPVNPERQGVLGLLTGKGTSSKSNSLADFLLDKGLVKELDEVMANTELELGNGSNDLSSELESLIAFSEVGGGIDDLLEGVDEVESVSLGEKGQIQVDQVGRMTGSQDALGKRSEESVRAVLVAYNGRLTYIYNKYLKRFPALGGKIVVQVVIAASGNVQSARIESSTMNNPEFDREVVNFIRRWKYQPIDSGTVTVMYPLFFNNPG